MDTSLKVRFNTKTQKYQWLEASLGWVDVHITRLNAALSCGIREIQLVEFTEE